MEKYFQCMYLKKELYQNLEFLQYDSKKTNNPKNSSRTWATGVKGLIPPKAQNKYNFNHIKKKKNNPVKFRKRDKQIKN